MTSWLPLANEMKRTCMRELRRGHSIRTCVAAIASAFQEYGRNVVVVAGTLTRHWLRMVVAPEQDHRTTVDLRYTGHQISSLFISKHAKCRSGAVPQWLGTFPRLFVLPGAREVLGLPSRNP